MIKNEGQTNPKVNNVEDLGAPPDTSIEAWHTNFALNSENFKFWTVITGLSIESDTIAAPDGSMTADTVRVTASDNMLMQNWQAMDEQTWTVSFWAQAPAPFTLVSHLSDGVLGTSFQLDVTTEWQRFTYTMTFAKSGVTEGAFFLAFHTPQTPVFHIWGAQIECGMSATAYIPTSGAAMIRKADGVLIPKDITFELALSALWESSLAPETLAEIILGLGFSDPIHFGDYRYGGLRLQHIASELAGLVNFLLKHTSRKTIRYLEVGMGNCGTMIFLHEVFKRNGIDLEIFGADNLSNQSPPLHTHQDKAIEWARRELGATFYRGETRDERFNHYLKGRKFDLIFINGHPFYETVAQDFLNSLPHLEPDGIMAIHNIASQQHPGVMTAYPIIQTYFESTTEIIHSDKCGIGLCRQPKKKAARNDFWPSHATHKDADAAPADPVPAGAREMTGKDPAGAQIDSFLTNLREIGEIEPTRPVKELPRRDNDETSTTRMPSFESGTISVFGDLMGGLRDWSTWSYLGWQDIRQRYRRSLIGPLWITISMGIMVAALGFLYSGLFHLDTRTYIPFIAVGFIVWSLIQGVFTEGCQVFIDMAATIKQSRIPLSTYVFRMVWRNFIVFLHNSTIILAVMIVFSIRPTLNIFLVIPGLAILMFNSIWVVLILGMLCARFRDIFQITASFLQVMFFITPIIWLPGQRPSIYLFLVLNPFYHFLQIIRAPLLGQSPELISWMAVIGITVLGWGVALICFHRYRKRVAYWI